MRKGSGRRRVGQVVGRHINSLYRSNRTVARRSNTFLHSAHFRCQCRLITYGRRHTSQQRGHLGTCLSETEYIINKEQYIARAIRLGTHITERLGYRQTGQCNRLTCTRRFVHLTEYQGYLRFSHFVIINFGKVPMTFFHSFLEFFAIADHTGFNHFPQQVVTFTGTLSYSGKHRKTILFLGDIID